MSFERLEVGLTVGMDSVKVQKHLEIQQMTHIKRCV